MRQRKKAGRYVALYTYYFSIHEWVIDNETLMWQKLFWKYLEQGQQKIMIYIAIKECRGCFLPESEKLLFRRNWQGLRESLLCFLAERCHNTLCNVDILGLVRAKGQLVLKANFEVFIWTKKWTKIFCISTLTSKWIKS